MNRFYNTNHIEDHSGLWQQGSIEVLANNDYGFRSQEEIESAELEAEEQAEGGR